MDARVFFSLVLILSSSCLSFLPSLCNGHPLKMCGFDRIYNLGDSLSDTGNLIRENPIGAATPFARLPYGETFFQNATGRCSNGLLMVDFLANAAGLPLLNPYKNSNAEFGHGVNFAVAGSTALPVEFLAMKNILSPVTNSSLDVQLQWMSTHLDSICNTDRGCMEKLGHSLFLVGEIGGNDYNYALFQQKNLEELKSIVPDIIESIMNAVKKVIYYGAARVVIPGNLPIGCLPIYLTGFQTNDSTAYDGNKCLKDLNNFSMYHNMHLQQGIEILKKEFPHVVIVYGDYYNAFMWLFENAPILGFDAMNARKACCGIGGEYNFNLAKMCGFSDVPVCLDPNTVISWDGVHLTQEAYKIMAGWLIHDLFPKLQCF